MKKTALKKFAIFLIFQLVIYITSLLYYNKITLLYYINISFCYAAALLLCALFIYIIQTGFYDIVGKSLTIAFSKDHNHNRTNDVTPLSKLFTLNYKPLLINGLLIIICSLTALFIYYV